MRSAGTLRAVVVAAVAGAVATLPACAPTPAEQVADLCRDLRSFEATFQLLLRPPGGARVGEVRGALEKVAPFLDRVADVGATPASLDDELGAVEERFRDALEELGDDEPASAADTELAPARARLADALGDAASALGCGALRATPEATV